MTRRRTTSRHDRSWLPLAGLLAGVGVLHFVRPEPFARIVPRRLGDPMPWVHGSGVAELACAAAVALPRTRRLGGFATAALFVGVFPANIQMAVTALGSERASPTVKAVSVGRLPLQAPLVAWALRVAARAGAGPRA